MTWRALLAALFLVFAAKAVPAEDLSPAPVEKQEAAGLVAQAPSDPVFGDLNTAERAELAKQLRVGIARECAAKKDILGWGRAVFPEIFHLPFCGELHDYLIAIRHEEFASTEAPRNHAKTTIKCFLIPLFQALEEPESYRHYLNVQATDEKAIAINRAIKGEIEDNEILKALYGDVKGERWTDNQFVLRVTRGDREYMVIFTARSAGQSIRGINYRTIRPDYILVDDLYNEEDLNNPESTEKKNRWLRGALYLARAKSRRCAFHVQGTAINNEDIYEQNKKNAKLSPLCDVATAKPNGRWICRTFKAIKDWDAKTVLWVELNTFDSLLADREDMGSLIFHREMQNERWDETSAIIKRSWLLPTDGRPSWEINTDDIAFGPAKARMIAIRLGNDPSVGEKLQSDFNAIALVWVYRLPDEKANRFHIVDLWNEQLTINKRLERLNEVLEAQPKERKVQQTRIEGIAGFKDYVELARGRVKTSIKEIDHVKDKITKRQLKARFFENRRVSISTRIDPKLKDELVYQLVNNFPKHDDLSDAVFLTLDDATNWADIL